MSWLTSLFGEDRHRKAHAAARRELTAPSLSFEKLESRTLLTASGSLAAGILTIAGNANTRDDIQVSLDAKTQDLLLVDTGEIVQRFSSAAVTQIVVNAGTADDIIRIDYDVTAQATINAGDGDNRVYAGGGPTVVNAGNGNNVLHGGPQLTLLNSGTGNDRLYAREGATIFNPGAGNNILFEVKNNDTVLATAGANDQVLFNLVAVCVQLTPAEVEQLLDRASAATPSQDGIIAIVDRGGRILGVRVEDGVNVNTPGLNPLQSFVFAIDGAVAEARTGGFFGNDQAPLTSRTVQFISQSTITQREVNSSPDVPGGPAGPLSTLFGPGYVAPIGVGGHFPPGVPQTPQVDLDEIEHTNRDSSAVGPGLTGRFNVANSLTPPASFGVVSGVLPTALPRGIGTLPGGIPIFKNGCVVGGIGVFYPGATGYASEENSILSADFRPGLPDRSFEAEFVAFAALGGIPGQAPIGTLGGINAVAGITLPSGRIDLVGITLDIFGPGGRMGATNLVAFGNTLGTGTVNGTDAMVPQAGLAVQDGFIVPPTTGTNAGLNLTPADINQIINQGIAQANLTRAAIRTPFGVPARFTYAISDLQGNVLGIFRQPDGTTFSIDVAVAKARNVAYYANPALLQPEDQVAGVPPGAALTNRTFRYLAQPRYPEGIDGQPPGPFSILTDGGANPFTGLQVGPALPATAFDSVMGFDSFNIGTNFHNPLNPQNQNGIVFFPGAVPLYKVDPATGLRVLVGGLGVSGDGVDQDDVVTAAAARGFEPPPELRADQFFFGGARLPYQKFNRNPEG